LRASAQEIGKQASAQMKELNATAKEATTRLSNSNHGMPPKAPEVSGDGGSTAKTAGGGADGHTKEELLQVLQKMNKKVKALSALRQQLTERVETSEAQKARLMNLVKEEILQSAPIEVEEEGADEIDQIQTAWRQVDENNQLTLQTLQSEFKKLAMEHQEEISKLKSQAGGGDSSSSGGGGGAGGFSKEEVERIKQELSDKYKADLQAAMEQMNKRRQEEVAAASANGDNKAGDNNEVNKIKAAAAQQLKAFKAKVAAARQTELAKLRDELGKEAEEKIAAKVREMEQAHKKEIDELTSKQQEITAAAGGKEQARQQLIEQHEVEMARLKESLE